MSKKHTIDREEVNGRLTPDVFRRMFINDLHSANATIVMILKDQELQQLIINRMWEMYQKDMQERSQAKLFEEKGGTDAVQ